MSAAEIENLRTVDRARYQVWRNSTLPPGDVDEALVPASGVNAFGSIQTGAGVVISAGGRSITGGLWYGASGPEFDTPIALDPDNPQQFLFFNMTGGFSYDIAPAQNAFRLYLASRADWSEYAWVYLGGIASPWYLAGSASVSSHVVRGAMDFATPGFDPGTICRLGVAVQAAKSAQITYNLRMGLGPVSYVNGPIRLVGGTPEAPHSFARMHALLRDPDMPYAARISDSSAAGIGLRVPLTIAADHFDATGAGFGFEPGMDDLTGRIETPAGVYSLGWDLPEGGSSRWATGLFAAPVPARLVARGGGTTVRAVTLAGLEEVWLHDGLWQDTTFDGASRIALQAGRCVNCTLGGPVAVTAQAGLSGGLIRATEGIALTIEGGAGDYSHLTPLIDSPLAAADLGIVSGGSYDLSGVRVPVGQALRLRNLNPTEAVTVTLAADVAVIAETVGGAIEVVQQRPSFSVSIANGLPGTLLLIQDVSTPTAPETLYLGRPTVWPYVWTDPEPSSASREIRVRAMLASGSEAAEFVDQIIGVCTPEAPDLSFRLNQRIDAIHAANGIDGAAVSGVVFDDAAALVRVARDRVSLPELYAAEAIFRATETGIVGAGRLLSATDPANYAIRPGHRIRNEAGPAALLLTGGYLRAGTEGRAVDAIDTTGASVILAPDHVVAYASAGGDGADADAIASAMRSAFAAEIARINALPADVAAQSAVLAAIEEAALL